ncbi:hypothetical protein BMW24_015610 [Mycobacterium heckeshornense]|nr:hypothetical protein ACT16_23070 [Mycobacterium heckeshornense]PIJ33214.1 hypothetical protein BMW24_015610 [Mycobacterium heckeshornense]
MVESALFRSSPDFPETFLFGIGALWLEDSRLGSALLADLLPAVSYWSGESPPGSAWMQRGLY